MIKCICIDDEPLALKQMISYIERTPFLELRGDFDSALAALSFLQNEKVDLMFVDINMPDLSGMDFVKNLENPPGIIFTTAYSEYAIEGYKVDAIDYLLKPISYVEFLKSAEKAKRKISSVDEKEISISANDDFLFIKSEYKIVRIEFPDIRYIEGMREYVRIHCESQKPLMALMSMKKMESFLPENNFMRVHRSYIVNLKKINVIERNRIVFSEKERIPVSDQYKDQFQKYLDTNFLL